MAGTSLDIRQSVYRTALNMAGTAANAGVDSIIAALDAEMGKQFEDRNVLLTDGGTVTFTGTAIQFSQNMNLVVNQKISGAAPQIIALGSTTVALASSGTLWWAVINRTAGTATTATGTTMPAVSGTNQEVFLLAARFDSADGTQMVYFRNGSTLTAGQSARIGSSGSGGGSGTGDDLDALNFSVSLADSFSDLPTSSLTTVDTTTGKTQAALYNSTSKYYALSYDAGKTATTSGTTVTMSAAPAYTVAVGDVIRSGTQVKRITAVASQTSYTIESAFTTALAASACCVSQCVYTKDLNNFAGDGVAPSAIYTAAISGFLLIYNDTASGTLYNYADPALVGYSASADGSNYSSVFARESNPSLVQTAQTTPTTGSNLYFRFFANATTGAGTVNLVGYKTFFQSQNAVESGGPINQAYAFTNGVGTPLNCTVTGHGQATQVSLTSFSYPVGLNAGSANGSILVFLNGQKIPRFVNSTLTPDASYIEVNGSTIQLDQDYSYQNLSVEILQLTYVTDSSSQNVTAISYINAHQFKNYLLNSDFDFWQRATTLPVATGGTGYAADRWYAKNSLGTSGVVTCSQVAPTNVGATYGCKVQITTAPTASQANGCELYQVVDAFGTLEMLNQLISGQVKVKAFGNVTSIGIQFCYATSEIKPTTFFGTEQTVIVNAATFVTGSLLGQSVGLLPTYGGVVGIRIRILGVSSGNTYDLNNGFVIEQAILNLGGAVAPYARCGRSIGDELVMCQRFYEKTYALTDLPGTVTATGVIDRRYTNSSTSQAIRVDWRFQVPKRINPTPTVYSTVNANTSAKFTVANSDVSGAAAFTSNGTNACTAEAVASAAQMGNATVAAHLTADAEI